MLVSSEMKDYSCAYCLGM